ncbi:MAG TPA: trypsin-like peptidase domain-containing protein [Solirubrobacterales bacterium]
MSRTRRFFKSSFGSAVLGGIVVGLFGWLAVAVGWIESDDGSAPASAETVLAAPVADHDGGDTNLVNEIYKRDGQGVAFIESDQEAQQVEPSPFNPFGESEGGGTATGSGFVIDSDGHLLTNNHVVEGASEITVKLGASDKSYSAEVVGADPATDVALLDVDAPADQLHPLALGDSSKVEVGDPVVAIGNPFGLDSTVTSGIVSALQRQIEAPNGFSISHVIQTDAAINPGNSGGPLIDSEGRVIGINSQIETGGGSSGGNVGIGFSIPINTAREVADQIERNGKVEHAYLGISGGSITPDLAKALNLPVDEGVLVAGVPKDGPAADAGIEAGDTEATIDGAGVTLGGDIITELDGKKVTGIEELMATIDGKKPGDEIEVTLLRDGDEKTVTVTLGNRPASIE